MALRNKTDFKYKWKAGDMKENGNKKKVDRKANIKKEKKTLPKHEGIWQMKKPSKT